MFALHPILPRHGMHHRRPRVLVHLTSAMVQAPLQVRADRLRPRRLGIGLFGDPIVECSEEWGLDSQMEGLCSGWGAPSFSRTDYCVHS
jgi:hypothetical protein